MGEKVDSWLSQLHCREVKRKQPSLGFELESLFPFPYNDNHYTKLSSTPVLSRLKLTLCHILLIIELLCKYLESDSLRIGVLHLRPGILR